jgi:hypothetical protein
MHCTHPNHNKYFKLTHIITYSQFINFKLIRLRCNKLPDTGSGSLEMQLKTLFQIALFVLTSSVRL